MTARVTRQNPLLTGRDLDTYGVYAVHRDGTTDDRANLAAADAAAAAVDKPLIVRPGTHLVSSALTINSPMTFRPGALIKPASGITVHLRGGVDAPLTQIFDLSAGGKVVVAKSVAVPDWWGAVGDGVADDQKALRAIFVDNSIANGDGSGYSYADGVGNTIHIPEGKIYASSMPIDIVSNTYVYGAGTIKCLSDNPNNTGGFILVKNACRNFTWIGPVLDINGHTNANGFAVGDYPATTDFVQDVHIEAVVRGARIDPVFELENEFSGPAKLFAGGGKGLTVQFRVRNFYANVITEDCDIACSVEAAVSDTRHLENVVIDLHAKDSHRTALFVGGSKDPAVSSLESASYVHSLYPGCKIRLRAQGGQDANVVQPETEIEGANYEHVGVVTLNYASGIDLEVYAATEERCTLIRGVAVASRIKVTHALMDELQDVWDTRPVPTLTPPGTYMTDNALEASIHAKTHHGVLIRPHRDGAARTVVKSIFEVDVWCQNGVGAITQNDGVTDEFGASVAYRFRDMAASPAKEIVGMSSHNVKPQWALAASGGRVAAERESWHNGTSEVAVFNAADGWHFPRMKFGQAPLVIGTDGAARRWLHWDQTYGLLRLAGSAPGSEQAGAALPIVNYSSTETDGQATPAVAGKSLLRTGNTAATTITNLTGGYNGQEVAILFNDANTTVAHNSTIKLRGGANRLFAAGTTLQLVCLSNVWYEIGSSDMVPLSSVVDSITEALGVGTLEVGNASDTTVGRVAAGRVAVEGAEVITATAVAAVAAKATPAGADTLALFDSAAGGAPKRITVAELKASGLPYDISYVQTVTTRAVGLGSNLIGTRAMRGFRIDTVSYRCPEADASGDLVVELRKNGAQIASSVATIAAANQTSATVVTGVNASFAAGDILTVYITAVGTSPGAGLHVDIAAVTV